MIWWGWLMVTIMVQLYCALTNPKSYQKGKLFTAPLRKRIPQLFDNNYCRFVQIMFLYSGSTIVLVMFSTMTVGIIYFCSAMALAIDDYLTDNDDLKRWMKEIRNKINWKMKLPAPAPAGSRVGS
jgi:hypothetical protein